MSTWFQGSHRKWYNYRGQVTRWTQKHGKSHFGYKNHVNVDSRHKLVRRYEVTDAAVHDSQLSANLLDEANACTKVWADSA